MIKLHYAKDNKEVTINTNYIISYEQYNESGMPAYTEVTALTDQCFDVKETPQEIDQLIKEETDDTNMYHITTVSNVAPNSNTENNDMFKETLRNSRFIKPSRWSNKPPKYKKSYRGRGRKREVGL